MSNIATIPTSDFSLRYTFECANPLTFFGNYNHSDDSASYVSGSSLVRVKFAGSVKSGRLTVSDGPPDLRKEVVARFRLNDDLQKIYRSIGTDAFMKAAIEKYRGMRVTLNDPWETTVCFIISQLNNVKRIRRITLSIIDRFGAGIVNGEGKVVAKSFPSSETLQAASIKELMRCGAGFRARYIKEAAEYCTNSMDLYKLRNHGYGRLKDELMEMTGVGDKVADCIALMGYGKLEAFPIDVWVKRTLERVYFKGKGVRIKELHRFADERFGRYAGYAENYIFWHGRHV